MLSVVSVVSMVIVISVEQRLNTWNAILKLPHIGHTSSKQTVRISLTSKHQRCGDLSEVDKPSTWELGPRILQVRTHSKEEVEMISYFHFHLSKQTNMVKLIGSKNVPKITVRKRRKIEKTS